MKLYWLIPLLFAFNAHADLSATVGLGKGVMSHEPFERIIGVGYKAPISDSFFVKPEMGGWLGGPGEPSWFAGAIVATQVWLPATGAYAHVGVGPAYISAPDGMLGGHYQFDTEFGCGLKDKAVTLGMIWKHFSSAGFEMPNLGRDFIGLQMEFKL